MGTRHDRSGAIPPRYKWLKRFCVAAAVLLLALLLLRLWWGHYANRKLEQTIASIRQKGEPLLLEEFDPPEIPDEHNAAWLLMKAERALTLTSAQTTLVDERRFDDWKQLQDIWQTNRQVLSLMRQARSLQQADWQIRLRTPAVSLVLPSLGGQRSLVKMADALLRYQHRQGNHAEAIEIVRDMLGAGDALDQMPLLIGYLVALGERNLAYDAIEGIAPTLSISPGSLRSGVPATRAQIEALIGELLDEQKVQAGIVRSMRGERAVQLDSFKLVAERPSTLGVTAAPPTIRDRLLAGVLGPMIKLDGVYMMEHMSRVAEAVARLHYPEAVKRMPSFLQPSGVKTITRLMSQILLPSLERGVLWHYHSLAMRRMAALALAIRLYELDHGARPETLNELVPAYLASIPEDPFASDGRPIAYLPHGQRPVLYSVSSNAIDQGGAYATAPDQEVEWEEYDLPFFLNADRPRPRSDGAVGVPAPSQAGEVDDDVEDDPGQDNEIQGSRQ